METNCSKNLDNCSKEKVEETNCSKKKMGKTNYSKNMDNCSKRKWRRPTAERTWTTAARGS